MSEAWRGVDLDGTVAHYEGWVGPAEIGVPIPLMVERIKGWLAAGEKVKIMTARVADPDQRDLCRAAIEKWCVEHLGCVLEITHEKDLHMIELWDDRAVRVIANTGWPAHEKFLQGQRVDVGPDGFVELLDYMGSDQSICQAARGTSGSEAKSPEDDRNLIRYLHRHAHTTPTEMAELQFLIRCPMDVWRQWIRHRTASVNEYSTRYREAIDSAATTLPGEWRLQAAGNRQGSEGFLGEGYSASPVGGGAFLSTREADFQRYARRIYEERLAAGVAKEQARKDLPLSTYTEAVWKIDLHNLLHFLSLRMDPHAQKEIRDFATVIGEEFVAPLFPLTWEAFNDYDHRRGGMLLSRREVELLRLMIDTGDFTLHLQQVPGPEFSKREAQEFKTKLLRMGVV